MSKRRSPTLPMCQAGTRLRAHPAKIAFSAFNGVFPNDYDLARAIVQTWKAVGIETDF